MSMEEDIIEWDSIIQTSEAEVLAEKVDAKYTRFKGADWFSWLYRRPVLLGGAGGIGSWVSMFLSRLGCHIYIYDFDIFERINLGK